MKNNKITSSTHEVLSFVDRELCLPITVMVMPTGKHSGKVIFNIDDDYLGSNTWANTGMPLKEFLATARPAYLVEKLFKKPYQIDDTDLDNFLKFIYKEYREQIKERLFNKNEDDDFNFHDILRNAYNAVIRNEHYLSMDFMYHNESTFEFFEKLFDSNWYESSIFKKVINPEFIKLEGYIKSFQKAMVETFFSQEKGAKA
ncbi:hypothetical protein QDS01_18300 [Acinetobacter nosocomialis]|uniref:hypothetical protein n=1 Tax=Acinetobacter nosocomialis TaxID=106654 RepID=UPI0024489391|nr:hypothetical protein [Acinetobacter nosocomialis]MDH2636865.1 hypothetical protein [Acinetobacter nosocomialis]